MPKAVCPSCGARQKPGATRCDFCGVDLLESSDPDVGPEDVVVTEPVPVRPSHGPVTCATCGHTNPALSRFCNQCGAYQGEVESVDAAEPVPTPVARTSSAEEREPRKKERPPSNIGRRAIGLIGLGVGVVVLLFVLTLLSRQTDRRDTPGEAPVAGAPEAGAPEVGSAELPDSLRAFARALEAEGTASAWAQLGHLYFSAAMRSDEPARSALAQRAVDAFDLSLGIEENPDVRTSLAEAAQFDTRNPMRPVLELQSVLETTPDHVAANYLLGALRARIGRLDGAAESFERVLALTPLDDPLHARAREDLAAIERMRSSAEE